MFHVRAVLRGNDDVGNGNGFVVYVNDGHLRLRVGAQPRHLAGLADAGEFASEAMGEHDGRGHEFGRFVAGITEHEPLVAGALLGGFLALGLAGVHALRDVGRLARNNYVHEDPVRMEDVVVIDVTDFPDCIARNLDEINYFTGIFESNLWYCDFAADDDDVGLGVAFAGDAAELVLREAGVQHGVGNGVANLVRMAFADGLR